MHPPFVFFRLAVGLAAFVSLSAPASLLARPLTAARLAQPHAVTAASTVGNAWHIPDDSGDLNGTHMRNPEFEVGASTMVTIYDGSQFQGNGNIGNQTGG